VHQIVHEWCTHYSTQNGSIDSFKLEADMNHFSMEVIGKERQKNLIQEGLREQAVRGYRRKLRLPLGRLFVIATTIVLIHFWF